MKPLNGKAGYILAEIIIATSLSLVILAALMAAYYGAYRTFQQQLVCTDLQYAQRAAMQMIIEDIMAAQEVSCINAGATLRLRREEGYISYYLQNQTLYRHGKAKMPVANDISDLAFYAEARPGYTVIYIEAGRGAQVYGYTCSACPRMNIEAGAGRDG